MTKQNRKTIRTIDVFVRDRNGALITNGATIRFKVNGKAAGEVKNAEGRGRIELTKPDAKVEISASYKGKTRTAKLGKGNNNYTFKFDVDVVGASFMEKHLPLWIGIVIFAGAIGLAFAYPSPSALQSRIILGAFSLGGGAIATEISGLLKVDLKLGQKVVIGATGAMAIFVILYLVLPA